MADRAKREAARLMYSGRPRSWLGRLARDIAHKIAGHAQTASACAPTLDLVGRLLRQRREDRSYRGHDAERHRVFISRQKRGITPTIRRELRRRNAIGSLIGHMKSDGHLERNFLLGTEGDAINAALAAAGHNLRLLPR